MERYKNLSGNSGVAMFELAAGSIVVQFQDGWKYEYTDASAGPDVVVRMQCLARVGRGLSAFISTTVRDRYARKFV